MRKIKYFVVRIKEIGRGKGIAPSIEYSNLDDEINEALEPYGNCDILKFETVKWKYYNFDCEAHIWIRYWGNQVC